jgi:putative membrane protein
MGSDVLLAIGHHIAAFTVLATLAAEWALVRPGLSRRDAIQVRVIDAVYGIAAGTVLVIGLMRVFLGPANASFYLSNPFFWGKISAFAIIGLLSIAGTTRYQRWATAAATDAAWSAPPAELTATRRALVAQLALFPVIPVCAALMARGIGA